jgi:hypothetical protein
LFFWSLMLLDGPVILLFYQYKMIQTATAAID